MRNEIYEGAASAASGGTDEAQLDFLRRFHQDAPDERLDAAAKAQLQLLFKHTAGFAIDTGLVDWLATDRVTLKKKKFYLSCAGQVGKVALRNAGAGKIGKTHLIKASDEIVEKHMDTCEERFIFCLDYDNMPR
jgi:hypothetical protein